MAKLQSGTRIYGTANIDSVLIVGNVTSNNTTAANTGSLQVYGGSSVTGNIYVGTTANVVGNVASTSNVTGTLIVYGGAGITGNLYVANVFTSGGVYDANTKLPIAGGGGGGSINVVNDISTSATFYPMLSTITSNTLSTTYVSTTKLYFDPSTGTFSATSFNSLSDENYKENIATIIDGLNIVDKINPVSFNWKDNNKKSYGVIAQEIEKIIPEIVDTTENDIKTVSYDQIIPFLIQAVQQLKKEIEDLKSQK